MKTATRLALVGALALCVLSPASAAGNQDKYQQDLTRVVQKYDGAGNVPGSSISFLAKHYSLSAATIRGDLAAAEASLRAPPAPEPVPDPEPEPYYEEEVEVEAPSLVASAPTPPPPAPEPKAMKKKRPPEKELRARIARIKSAFQSVNEETSGKQSWVYHQYTDRDSQAYLDGVRVLDQSGDHRFEMNGGNIGRDDVNFAASYKGDRAKLSVKHDGTPHTFVVGGKTMFRGVGTTALTLDPAMRTAATGTAAQRTFAWFNEYMRAPLIDVGIVRERTSFDVDLYHDNSDTVFKVSRDKRSGTRVGYSYDGADRYELPIPIDYETMDYTLSTERTRDNFWFRASMLLSDFHNANDTMTWQSGSRAAGNARETQLLDLAPENERQLLSFAGSVRDLPKDGRFNFNYSKGKMQQNDPLVNYSSAIGSGSPLLPQMTAGQEVETTQFGTQYTMRPTDKFRVKLGYKGYEYHDKGSKIPFNGSAVSDGNFTADLTGAHTTEHLSYEKKTFDVGLTYDVNSKNTAQLRWSKQDTERHEREVGKADEETYKVIWDARPTDRWQLRFSYENADRNHKGYDFLAPFRQQVPANTTPNNNTPWMRKFLQASRERDAYNFSATFLPKDDVAITFSAQDAKDDYDEANTFGLKSEDENMLGIDIDYRPTGKRYGMNFFGNIEERDSTLVSRAWRAGFTGDPYLDPGAMTPFPIASDWTLDQTDDIETFGFRFDWNFEPNKLDGQFGWTRSLSDGNFAFNSPVGGLPEAALPGGAATGLIGPDSNNFLPGILPEMSDMVQDTYDLRFDYKVKQYRTLAMGVRHETFDWKDWEVAGWTPVAVSAAGTETGMLFIDQRPKNFHNTTVWFSYGFEF